MKLAAACPHSFDESLATNASDISVSVIELLTISLAQTEFAAKSEAVRLLFATSEVPTELAAKSAAVSVLSSISVPSIVLLSIRSPFRAYCDGVLIVVIHTSLVIRLIVQSSHHPVIFEWDASNSETIIFGYDQVVVVFQSNITTFVPS